MSEKILGEFEASLDLFNPEGGAFGCKVLDYGEVSVVLTLEAIPGKALKRMSGFASKEETADYMAAVLRYIGLLTARGVSVLPTSCIAVHEPGHVVYLVQPLVPKEQIGNSLLRTADADSLARVIESTLDSIVLYLRSNKSAPDGVEVAADSQLSNWYFEKVGEKPQLVDIGSPIVRKNGKVHAYADTLYRSFPWPLNPVLKWVGVVEGYFNDYFDCRLAILDMLGNFIKEKAADRLPEGVAVINRWLARQPEKDEIAPFTVEDAHGYYGKDAFLLELMWQVRRATRFTRTRIFRKRYDYILPGKIDRR